MTLQIRSVWGAALGIGILTPVAYYFWLRTTSPEVMPLPEDLPFECTPSNTGPSALLDVADGEGIFRWRCRLSQEAPIAPWAPEPQDVEHLEARLPSFMATQHIEPKMESLDSYVRQYAGFQQGGRKGICVNFVDAGTLDVDADSYRTDRRVRMTLPKGVCSDDFWRHVPINAVDGGVLYCGVAFDVGTGEFWNLNCNGM